MRHVFTHLVVLVIAGAGITVAAQTPVPAPVPAPVDRQDQQLGRTGTSDRDFAREVAIGSTIEIELGTLATTKADSQKIKAFGQLMVSDHGKIMEELKRLAALSNIALPTEIDPVRRDMVSRLSGLSGEAFDRAFAHEMVEGHRSAVGAFQYEAEKGTDPALKEFASKTFPMIQEHLKAIEELQRALTLSQQ